MHGEPFLALQMRFADALSTLAQVSFGRALMDGTNCYIRLGLGREFDATNPEWQRFARDVENADNRAACAHALISTCGKRVEPPAFRKRFGCFGYSVERALTDASHEARLHFINAEPADVSPLADSRQTQRIHELATLFDHIATHAPDVTHVTGTSWLYNLPRYRRLFPADYFDAAQGVGPRWRNLSLWGQFLMRDGNVRTEAARVFLERVDAARSLADLACSFALQPLAPRAPLSAMLDHYAAANLKQSARDA